MENFWTDYCVKMCNLGDLLLIHFLCIYNITTVGLIFLDFEDVMSTLLIYNLIN